MVGLENDEEEMVVEEEDQLEEQVGQCWLHCVMSIHHIQ